MKLLRMTGTSVLIVLFITVGLCFGQRTAKQNLFKDVEHAVKWKFEDAKEEFERTLEEVAIETISACEGVHPFRDCISQEDSTGSLADLDDSEDDFEKILNELKKQFEEFSKELKRVPESEEFKRVMKELERLQEELKRGGESAKEKIEKEIIPRLKEEMEKLKERFLKPREMEAEEPIEV
jgi:uncharacterized coiled-coil DUF342 family protein